MFLSYNKKKEKLGNTIIGKKKYLYYKIGEVAVHNNHCNNNYLFI